MTLLTFSSAGTAIALSAAASEVRQHLVDTDAPAVRKQLRGDTGDLAAFYAARRYRPLWLAAGHWRPEAKLALEVLSRAADDNLDLAQYPADEIARLMRRPEAAARARGEILLSRAVTAYIADLHRPRPDAALVVTDNSLAPRAWPARAVLDRLAAGSLEQALTDLRRMHPLYEALRSSLIAERGAGGSDLPLIRANLERLRVLPADPGPRYILVDAAAARLWLYENGRIADSMKVVVGKPGQQTPAMSGVIRYAVVSPYWNLPPDLVQTQLAPRVLRGGPGVLAAEHMEVLSGWEPDARPLDPADIDWAAVAAGRRPLRVRQAPGPWNMMGEVKFMLPNRLGIYLHDTPHRWLFARQVRAASAGCVRLEDARRLAVSLLGSPPGVLAHQAEQRVDLDRPVPVYILYLTVAPGPEGLERRTGVYRRDPALLAAL